MLKYTCFAALLLLSNIALGQTKEQITEHGYRFFHHIQKNGSKPKRGESVRAYVNVFVGDTLLSSSRKNLGGTYKFDIAPEGAELAHYPPLMDATLLMGVGDSATIYQPVDSSMKVYLPKNMRNEKELRFEIAMVQIITEASKAIADQAFAERAVQVKAAVEQTIKDYREGNLKEKMLVLKSGLRILTLEKGPGKLVRTNEAVQVHYYGYLKNGTSFDNSFDRRRPLAFPVGVGQMIAGFDEGVQQLTHGSKAFLFIPSALAYGEEEAAGGLIPPNSELIFYIEVL
jgi:FKBP-type peptidyl-prolyl cis-trans isomerase